MISKLKDLELGQIYHLDGVRCIVKSFPFRTSIVVEAIKPESGKWSSCKMSVREFSKRAVHAIDNPPQVGTEKK